MESIGACDMTLYPKIKAREDALCNHFRAAE